MSASEVAVAPFLAACGLLAVSGAAKLRQPAPVARAIRALAPCLRGLRGSMLGRAVGAVEVGSGLAGAVAVATGVAVRPAAVCVAAVYAALAGAALRLAVRAPDTDCGCFGERSVPAGAAHVATDLGATAAAVGVAMAPVELPTLLAGQPFAGVAWLVLVVLLGVLAHLTMTGLRELALASRGGSP